MGARPCRRGGDLGLGRRHRPGEKSDLPVDLGNSADRGQLAIGESWMQTTVRAHYVRGNRAPGAILNAVLATRNACAPVALRADRAPWPACQRCAEPRSADSDRSRPMEANAAAGGRFHCNKPVAAGSSRSRVARSSQLMLIRSPAALQSDGNSSSRTTRSPSGCSRIKISFTSSVIGAGGGANHFIVRISLLQGFHVVCFFAREF
jgi:hypothetical protein